MRYFGYRNREITKYPHRRTYWTNQKRSNIKVTEVRRFNQCCKRTSFLKAKFTGQDRRNCEGIGGTEK